MVLAGHHQPPRVWVLCLPFMGLNLSNQQIALELGLDASDMQAMTEQLRRGLVAKAPTVELTGEVEPDARAFSGIAEVYVMAGHKGQPKEWPKGAARALPQLVNQLGKRASSATSVQVAFRLIE